MKSSFKGRWKICGERRPATKLPCLRKDFIVDEFQLLEARANGADAVLLIVAALSAEELNLLAGRAGEYGLDVLCEVHDEDELRRAADAGCTLIGVNSRDLRTFKVDLETAFRLADSIPKNCAASSGERNPIAAQTSPVCVRLVTSAFLIGESLMKAKSPGEALKALLVEAQRESHVLIRT